VFLHVYGRASWQWRQLPSRKSVTHDQPPVHPDLKIDPSHLFISPKAERRWPAASVCCTKAWIYCRGLIDEIIQSRYSARLVCSWKWSSCSSSALRVAVDTAALKLGELIRQPVGKALNLILIIRSRVGGNRMIRAYIVMQTLSCVHRPS